MKYLLLGYACAGYILAAETTDPLSGGAGWVGAGLLGLVLSWLLLVRLPAQDRQLKELMDCKDVQIKGLIQAKDSQLNDVLARKWEMIKDLGREYKEGLKEVTTHCEAEISQLTTSWREHIDHLSKAINDMASEIREHGRNQNKSAH